MSSCRTILCGFAFVLFLLTPVRGGVITEIGPFVGELTEDWESFVHPNPGGETPLFLTNPTAIMGGAALISGPGMQIYDTYRYSFSLGTSGGAQVVDGNQGMGFNQRDGTVTLVFETPARQFGSYWGAATDSNPLFGSDPSPVEIRFYDELDFLIGTSSFLYTRSAAQGYPLDGLLMWHGWRFNAPVKTVTYTGDYVVVDGMQADLIPEPSSLVLVFLGFSLAGWRQTKR